MKKYLVTYNAPNAELDEMMKTITPEQAKEMDRDWNKWIDLHKASFVDQGSPLGKNKRITKDGVKDVRNEINGYSVVQAESHDEAAKIFLDNPQLQMKGAYVDVVEWVDMPEM